MVEEKNTRDNFITPDHAQLYDWQQHTKLAGQMKFGAVLRKWDTHLGGSPPKNPWFTVLVSMSQALTGSHGKMKDEDLKSYGVIVINNG